MRRTWLALPLLIGGVLALAQCAGLGWDPTQLSGEESLTDEIAGSDPAPDPLAALPAVENAGGGPAEESEPEPEVVESDTLGDEITISKERVSDHYTRVRQFGGRFGGSRSMTRGSGSGRRVAPLSQLTVVYEDGSAAAGAELHDRHGRLLATVDAAGVARGVGGRALHHNDGKGRWSLEGRRLFVRRWIDRGYDDGTATIALWTAGRALDGRVVDQHGVPVAGVVVHVKGPEPQQVTTDALGRFELSDVTPSAMNVEVEHPELFRHPMPDWIAEGLPGPAPLTITAVRGTVHDVRITDDDGDAMPKADVTYDFRWPQAVDGVVRRKQYQATADAHGIAKVLVVPGHDLSAYVRRKGFPTRSVRGLAGLMPARLDIQLRKHTVKTWIPVRCRDARTGDEVQPTRVLVRRVDQPWIVGDAHSSKTYQAICHEGRDSDPRTDFDVRDLEDLPTGLWEIWLWAPGHAPVTVIGDATTEGIYPPLDVRLPEGPQAVQVRVCDAGTGELLKGASIRVSPVAGQGGFLHPARFARSDTAASGKRAFDLPPGDYELTARLNGYHEATQRVLVSPGTAPVTLALARE